MIPNLPLCLPPVLSCSTVLAASLLVQFIGTLGDLRGLASIGFYATTLRTRHLIIATFRASLTTRHETIA